MKTIVLVTCVKEKLTQPCTAQNMYIGDLFAKLMTYARGQNPDEIFILSGKYGLLELDQKISPYDVNLNEVTEEELKKWSVAVLEQLSKYSDLNKDNFILLCNPVYAKYLKPKLNSFSMPIIIK